MYIESTNSDHIVEIDSYLYPLLTRHKWSLVKSNQKVPAGYLQATKLKKIYGEQLLHRVVWTLVNGPIPKGMTIDHIDRNPHRSTIYNLRLATREQQARNKSNNKKIGLLVA